MSDFLKGLLGAIPGGFMMGAAIWWIAEPRVELYIHDAVKEAPTVVNLRKDVQLLNRRLDEGNELLQRIYDLQERNSEKALELLEDR